MSLRFYLDEDFSRAAHSQVLTRAGYDVLRPQDVGMLARHDPEQLGYAAASGRMLSSYNERDFQRLHTEWVRVNRHHSGILLVVKRSNYSPGEDLRRIAQLDNALEDADARDLLLYLSNFG